MKFFVILLTFNILHLTRCWTTEDMELFDLVENTPKNFYDVLGVDQKASASDIRKAYRKLSTLYHPDRNKESNAEETFRTLAAVADVLRDEERRKMYDVILQTGLPDWRTPIYYYRRARNMGLFELCIFLFGLATLGQYIFAWSAYWEKKYEIEEVVLSRIRRKAKHQRKGVKAKADEEASVSEAMSSLQKPGWRDLFPVLLVYFIVDFIKSFPMHMESLIVFVKSFKSVRTEDEEEESEEPLVRVKTRKTVKSKIPDYSSILECDPAEYATISNNNLQSPEQKEAKEEKWEINNLSEHQKFEFKKAMKKFPVGTLQRWEKIAIHLGCSTSDVVAIVKQIKNQKFSNGIPVAMQGVTGTEKENLGTELYEEKDALPKLADSLKISSQSSPKPLSNPETCERIWKQEEQRCLELALQKFPKDTPARWDRIAEFVASKTKEECIERFKILAHQVKQRKNDKGL